MRVRAKYDELWERYQRCVGQLVDAANERDDARAEVERLNRYADAATARADAAEVEAAAWENRTIDVRRERDEAWAEVIPMRLPCPSCGTLHIDVGEFATKVHHTHACQNCGMVWRPTVVPTVGVRFLPGFKDEPSLAWCPNCGDLPDCHCPPSEPPESVDWGNAGESYEESCARRHGASVTPRRMQANPDGSEDHRTEHPWNIDCPGYCPGYPVCVPVEQDGGEA